MPNCPRTTAEKGFAHIVMVLLLVVGIGVGTYLVQQKTNFSSKAASNYQFLPLSIDPQYLIVNKTEVSPEGTCCSWNWFYTNNILSCDGSGASSGMDCTAYKGQLTTVDEIRDKIFGAGARDTRPDTKSSKRRLGISYTISYFNYTNKDGRGDNQSKIDELIKNITILAVQKEMPILIKLDGLSWMDKRPDLWNWWDPASRTDCNDWGCTCPNSDPQAGCANKDSVEWTGWDPSTAIKKSWRNWGTESEINPQPNLGSPAYIQAKQAALRRIIPQIARWYKSLPSDKKYLLAGIALDNELSIGVNHYYYPGGQKSSLYKFDLSKGPSFGMQQLGYAAAKSYGIKSSGIITIADLNTVIKRHSQMLSQTAREAGLTEGVDLFDKIYVHGGGNSLANYSFSFAYSDIISNNGRAGWSFYNLDNPAKAGGFWTTLDALGNSPWVAAEWNPDTSNTQPQWYWEQSLRNTFNTRNNRIIDLYNWEGITRNPNALAAMKNILLDTSACVVGLPNVGETVADGVVTFYWQKGASNQALYLTVSTSNQLNPSGNLQNVNIINDKVGSLPSYSRKLPPGVYYWNLTADGCYPTQRRVTETRKFTVLASAITPTPETKPFCMLCDGGILRKAGDPNDCNGAPKCPDLASGTNACNASSDISGQKCNLPTSTLPTPTVTPTPTLVPISKSCFVCDGGKFRRNGDPNDCGSSTPACPTLQLPFNVCWTTTEITGQSCGQ